MLGVYRCKIDSRTGRTKSLLSTIPATSKTVVQLTPSLPHQAATETPQAHTTGTPNIGNCIYSGHHQQTCNNRPAHSARFATPAPHTRTHPAISRKREKAQKNNTIQKKKKNTQLQPHTCLYAQANTTQRKSER